MKTLLTLGTSLLVLAAVASAHAAIVSTGVFVPTGSTGFELPVGGYASILGTPAGSLAMSSGSFRIDTSLPQSGVKSGYNLGGNVQFYPLPGSTKFAGFFRSGPTTPLIMPATSVRFDFYYAGFVSLVHFGSATRPLSSLGYARYGFQSTTVPIAMVTITGYRGGVPTGTVRMDAFSVR